MCDLEREIGPRLSRRILGVHPFATLIMPLRLVEGKTPAFRVRDSFSIEASWRIEARGLFRDRGLEGVRRIQGEGNARTFAESNRPAQRLTSSLDSVLLVVSDLAAAPLERARYQGMCRTEIFCPYDSFGGKFVDPGE
jgi:hypothetical protein